MVKIKNCSEKEIVLEVTIKFGNSMLKSEETIQREINEAGNIATGELLSRFDTDGSAIRVGGVSFTSKGKVDKKYQTPYGEQEIGRHVYQGSKGGSTYIPMEANARILESSTPRLSKMLSHKYAQMGVDEVQKDLSSNHGRKISRGYVQSISELVGMVAMMKEEKWEYELPEMPEEVKSISLGLDGTTMYLRGEGYREAMVGTIAFYDDEGRRLHTSYVATTPEYGKENFFKKMSREIKKTQEKYSEAKYIGIADGAKDNWPFLKKYTELQVTDFWHVSEYLSKAAEAIFPESKNDQRKKWLKERCSQLKNKQGAAGRIIKELELHAEKKLSKTKKEKLNKTITYFRNQKVRMKYESIIKQNLPIGSGVTEAACKTIIKQRLCQSGMRWNKRGAAVVLSIRCLDRSNRWDQFWGKIDQYGLTF